MSMFHLVKVGLERVVANPHGDALQDLNCYLGTITTTSEARRTCPSPT